MSRDIKVTSDIGTFFNCDSIHYLIVMRKARYSVLVVNLS